MKADELPSGQKQRNIQYNGQNAHWKRRNQDIDYLGQAGNTAHGDLIGGKEPVKAQGKCQGPQGNDGIAFQKLFHVFSSSRPSCRSSVSSCRSSAPAAGMARTR